MDSLVDMPDIISEAMSRRGRYTPPFILSNNYIAEAHSSHWHSKKKSSCSGIRRKRRRKAGARRGNRNALKSGLYSAEAKALRLHVRMVLARLKLATAQARLLAVQLGR